MKEKTKKMAATAYLRTSAVGNGLEIQRKAIRKYAEKNNFTIVNEFQDSTMASGLAGRQRQGLSQALKTLTAGDVLIVTDHTRLSRDKKELTAILSELKRRRIKVIADLHNNK